MHISGVFGIIVKFLQNISYIAIYTPIKFQSHCMSPVNCNFTTFPHFQPPQEPDLRFMTVILVADCKDIVNLEINPISVLTS